MSFKLSSSEFIGLENRKQFLSENLYLIAFFSLFSVTTLLELPGLSANYFSRYSSGCYSIVKKKSRTITVRVGKIHLLFAQLASPLLVSSLSAISIKSDIFVTKPRCSITSRSIVSLQFMNKWLLKRIANKKIYTSLSPSFWLSPKPSVSIKIKLIVL